MTNDTFAALSPEVRDLARIVWDYHHMNQPLTRADALLVLCSHDTVVADHAADLFLQGWAPLLIFSGGLGSITSRFWSEPEADQFAAIAVAKGVPRDAILIENQSTNTGENILFTQRMLEARGLAPNSFIVVQKPYMERRAWATFRKLWPEKALSVTSPPVALEDYLRNGSHEALSADEVITIMVGDLQRIRVYPEKGFQIEQEIPDHVWRAFNRLVELGYGGRLV